MPKDSYCYYCHEYGHETALCPVALEDAKRIYLDASLWATHIERKMAKALIEARKKLKEVMNG